MQYRFGVALVALATLAVVPSASAATKLYTVSLSGSARTELTRVRTVPPPPGCTGTVTETERFVASGRLSPKPRAVPVSSYSRLKFNARLTSYSAAASSETQGGWTPDPTDPFPVDPSQCAFTPERKTAQCTFSSAATRATGGEYALLPLRGKYQLYFNRSGGVVRCTPDDLGGSLLEDPFVTKLSASAVRGLGRGASTSASGTSRIAAGGSTTGGQTLNYQLKVKRVQ
jgi:hypothetical protein